MNKEDLRNRIAYRLEAVHASELEWLIDDIMEEVECYIATK